MSKITTPSAVGDSFKVDIDPYANNPIADDYRAVSVGTYSLGSSELPQHTDPMYASARQRVEQ